MWSEISKLIGANPIMSLIITIFGTSTIWMYKEFKEMINRNNTKRITNLNEKIKVYSQLQAHIAAVLHDKDNHNSKINLIRNLGEYSPILSENVRNVAKDYYIKADPAYLSTMLAMMEVDFKQFEQEKARVSKYENNAEIEDIVVRLYDPLKPILFVWLSIWFFSYSYIHFTEQQVWYNKVNVIAFSFSWFIGVATLSALISLKLEGKLSKQGIHRWLAYSLIIIIPVITFIKSLSLVAIAIQVICILIIIKIKRKNSGIITFD